MSGEPMLKHWLQKKFRPDKASAPEPRRPTVQTPVPERPVVPTPTRTWTKEGGLEVHHANDSESTWPKWARAAAEEGSKVYHSAYEPRRRPDTRSWTFPHGRSTPWI